MTQTLVCIDQTEENRSGYDPQRVIVVNTVDAARAVLMLRPTEIDCFVLRVAVETHEMLEVIATLPDAFTGDVVLLRGDRGFVSACGAGRQRRYYALGGLDLEVYLEAHAIGSKRPAPLRAVAQPKLHRDVASLPLATVLPPTAPAHEGQLVLIADDDRVARALAAGVLRGLGYPVVLAGSGLQAIRLTETLKPTVILLDGLMPEMHGFEVARFVRQLSSTYRPRIILMTAIYKGLRYQNEAKLKYGIDGYLIKPLAEASIAQALASAVVGDPGEAAFAAVSA